MLGRTRYSLLLHHVEAVTCYSRPSRNTPILEGVNQNILRQLRKNAFNSPGQDVMGDMNLAAQDHLKEEETLE